MKLYPRGPLQGLPNVRAEQAPEWGLVLDPAKLAMQLEQVR